MAELSRRMSQLRAEEARLGRLLITGRMTEETYDQLRAEWLEKLHHAEANLADLERETAEYLDDLDVALVLMAKAHALFERLEDLQRRTLLQILMKQIMVSQDGEMIDHELDSPFTYLTELVVDLQTKSPQGRGSDQVRLGTPTRTRTWASASGGPRSIL